MNEDFNMETDHASNEKRSRFSSVRPYLQIGVVVFGALVALWGFAGLLFVFPTMPQSESGFAEGLALIIFGLYFLGGFVILSLGLLIPQTETSGIQFTTRQRKLLGYGATAPIVGILAVPVVVQLVAPYFEPIQSVLFVGVLGFIFTGPLATVIVIVTKIHSWLR